MDLITKYKQTREQLFHEFDIQPAAKVIQTGGPGQKVHYLEMGEGPPMLLVHGGGSHSSEWIPIMKPLARHFKLYIPDRPGHGLNDFFDHHRVDFRQLAVDFMRSFTEALQLPGVSIVGNSIGGFYGINFAMRYPDRVKDLVLIGAPAGLSHWIPLPLRLMGTKFINNLLMKTVAKPNVKNTADFHQQVVIYDVRKLSDAYLEHMACHMKLRGKTIRNLLESILTMRGWKDRYYIADELDQIKVKTHFIWGKNDAFETPESGLAKAGKIPDHQFAVVEQAGHCPWLDRPEECTALLLTMLKKNMQRQI